MDVEKKTILLWFQANSTNQISEYISVSKNDTNSTDHPSKRIIASTREADDNYHNLTFSIIIQQSPFYAPTQTLWMTAGRA